MEKRKVFVIINIFEDFYSKDIKRVLLQPSTWEQIMSLFRT